MDRRNVSSETPWEKTIGFSRAVRSGNLVWVAGTVAADATGTILHPGDAYKQTLAILENIKWALEKVEASLADVTRTRMYLTDIGHLDAVGRAHREYFGPIKPAATIIQIVALADPAALVEIEVEAMTPEGAWNIESSDFSNFRGPMSRP